ncbi:MAG: diaminopimelate epimerase [Elusimicrobiota bacterium]
MKLAVSKFSATGNSFVLLDAASLSAPVPGARKLSFWAKKLSQGLGSDGFIFAQRSRGGQAGVKMTFFNPDGTQAFCGNGTRTTGFYMLRHVMGKRSGVVRVGTSTGPIEVSVNSDRAALTAVAVPEFKGEVRLKGDLSRQVPAPFFALDSGCPHAVCFVPDVARVAVESAGRAVRYDEAFAPAGTNVDFVEVVDDVSIKLRTYERGVERETLSCGSGALAAAWACQVLKKTTSRALTVRTQGGILRVSLDSRKLALEGQVGLLFEGIAYV